MDQETPSLALCSVSLCRFPYWLACLFVYVRVLVLLLVETWLECSTLRVVGNSQNYSVVLLPETCLEQKLLFTVLRVAR